MLCLVSVWYLLVHIVLLWLLHNMLWRDGCIPGSSVHHARVSWLHTHVERGWATRVDDTSRWGGLACCAHLLVRVWWVLHGHARPTIRTPRVERRSPWCHHLSSCRSWASLPSVRVRLLLWLWLKEMVL